MPSTPTRKHRILIVDDHPVVRLGLRRVIEQETDMEVCGEAGSVAEAMREVAAHSPDIAIVDISLEGESGIELVKELKAHHPRIKSLVSSFHEEKVFAGRVVKEGASGYIEKKESIAKIVEGIRKVLQGEIFVSPAVATQLLTRAASGQSLSDDPVATLSTKELEVFEMIGLGLTVQQIGRRLNMSAKTVESHRRRIKTKLRLETATQLNHAAFEWVQKQR
jgi:DNA-binding NarL/FixJ family response regulator